MTNYVLVHGSSHGAWCWERLLPHLRRDGRVERVIAVDLVGHGARLKERDHALIRREDYVDDVVRAIEGEDLWDVVLVGHSMAGYVVPPIATRVRARLKHVVFVAGGVAREGQTPEGVMRELDHLGIAEHADLPPRQRLFHDVDDATAQWGQKHLTREPPLALTEPIMRCAFPQGLPHTYVVTLKDRVLSPAMQRELLKKLPAPEVVELDAGHAAMLSQPEALARVLLRYA